MKIDKQTMRAVVLTGYGGTDMLEIREVPDPKVGSNQIKVRMAGASINPIDWRLRSGRMKALMPIELPAILGRDASGLVVEVGPGVTAFAVGHQLALQADRAPRTVDRVPLGAYS